MAKFCSDTVLDAALDYLMQNATRAVVCSAQPANFAGVAALTMAEAAIDPTDFALSAGVTSGRRATLAALADIPVDVSGTANHVALVDDVASELLYVTTCPAKEIAAAGAVSITAFDIEIRDPA